MTKDEIIGFINSNLICHLATSEDGQPHVRGMMAYRADEKGIIFHTGKTKDLYKQLLDNPLVEVCFFDQKTNTQVRVKGKAQNLDDDNLKRGIVAARPFLRPWVDELGLDILAVFRITECEAVVWTFETNFKLKEYIKLA